MINDLLMAAAIADAPLTLDPMWDQVSFLLDMESGSFKNKKSGAAVTNAGANIDGNKIFLGQKCAFIPNGVNGLSTAESVIAVGTGDFCLDTYVQLSGNNGGYQYPFWIGGGNQSLFSDFGDGGYGYRLQACLGNNPANLYYVGTKTKGDFMSNLVHVAYDRKDGIFRVFVGGVKLVELANGTSITAAGIASIGSNLAGWINRFRFTKASRWTADFNPSQNLY